MYSLVRRIGLQADQDNLAGLRATLEEGGQKFFGHRASLPYQYNYSKRAAGNPTEISQSLAI